MRSSLVISAFAMVIVGACGGGPQRPSPLDHTMDDGLIASVPVDSKQSVVQSKSEFDVAVMERAKAQSDMGEIDTQLSIARNDAKQAELQVENAQTEKDAAQKSANVARQSDADQKFHSAQVAKKAADAKVDWLESRKHSLDKWEFYEEWNVSAREARYQLEKAKVAQQNGIRPAGFDLGGYETQASARSDGALRAKQDADSANSAVEEKHKAYDSLEKEAAPPAK